MHYTRPAATTNRAPSATTNNPGATTTNAPTAEEIASHDPTSSDIPAHAIDTIIKTAGAVLNDYRRGFEAQDDATRTEAIVRLLRIPAVLLARPDATGSAAATTRATSIGPSTDLNRSVGAALAALNLDHAELMQRPDATDDESGTLQPEVVLTGGNPPQPPRATADDHARDFLEAFGPTKQNKPPTQQPATPGLSSKTSGTCAHLEPNPATHRHECSKT